MLALLPFLIHQSFRVNVVSVRQALGQSYLLLDSEFYDVFITQKMKYLELKMQLFSSD